MGHAKQLDHIFSLKLPDSQSKNRKGLQELS